MTIPDRTSLMILICLSVTSTNLFLLFFHVWHINGKCTKVVTSLPACVSLSYLLCAGSVWSWGDGDFGKLGRGGSDGCKTPTVITQLKARVIKVFCGPQFSLSLTNNGHVYSWLVCVCFLSTGLYFIYVLVVDTWVCLARACT